ncbi:MAG: polyprenyl synthetase family protein [Bacteroides sp.]|nr:polyprenyl synthetase family protein [Bacillota bacterium]MCM1394283.1 polyprenyl synthetase family protein [[Eubacterium] siraeum]MCM1456210.1 polyprenyl synthetase family protein [Bacteroides sp.]
MKVAQIDRTQFLKNFEEYFSEVLGRCEGVLGEAMRYAALDGGKRIRPLCVYFGSKAVGGRADICDILPLASAIELIHSYSLVHDDMPEMDNDDVRRGKSSVHKKFGVATALLTGDALLSLAMAQTLKTDAEASCELAKSALDMVYGQSEEFEGCDGEVQWLSMYAKKTGALIRGAFRAGAICSGASDCEFLAVTQFAECVGLAFQLSDDLLDGDKSIVDVIGRDRAQILLDKQFVKARKIADGFADKDEILKFADELQFRKA